MPKCPACGKDIDSVYLDRLVSARVTRSFNVSYNPGSSTLELTHMDERDEVEVRDIISETYYCPECNGEIAHSGDEIVNILKGED